MQGRFEHRTPSGWDWQPFFGEVDWKERETAARHGEAILSLYFITEDEYETEVTQENCVVHCTQAYVDDPLDVVMLQDDRDGNWWSWYRQNNPNFETIMNCVRNYCTMIVTPYPTENVVKTFQELSSRDLETNIPKEWLTSNE